MVFVHKVYIQSHTFIHILQNQLEDFGFHYRSGDHREAAAFIRRLSYATFRQVNMSSDVCKIL